SHATSEELQALVKRASEGANAFAAANFAVAVAHLTQAVDGLTRESGALATQPALRTARKDALPTLAQALAKLKRTDEARVVLAEACRSYPELTSFPETVYPPRIVELGNQILRERATHPGALVIETVPPGRPVLLNEQPLGDAPRTARGLLPG